MSVRCASCGNDNRAGRKFCVSCGKPLARSCPACGAPYEQGERFCGDCGGALSSEVPAAAPARTVTEERRLVTVLFADLVGFTAFASGRDPEDVRALLTAYFELSRRTVERYGGVVEKFIGDAVMAIWGTPTAREDDAERAIRAALDLTAAIAGLGAERGAPALRLRAGVLTGEAIADLAASGQGIVTGELVNAASRIQSAAQPGNVLVGDATRRATEAAIAYEDAGSHELKGIPEPLHLWRALRVMALRGGALRSSALEPPFVGRDAELRLVKDLLHATIDERKARLASVIGVAGIGKSRLAWELQKYVDGLALNVYWHRGRCLPYGEGVTYWALLEAVRMRAGIAEEDDGEVARAKLRAALERHVPAADERAWIEPRLQHVLGLAGGSSFTRDDVFSALRVLFERLSDEQAVVLVLEDLQWADVALLDFVEHLLEWSRDHPIFVVTLARPELLDRRAGWGTGRRAASALTLEPLGETAMRELIAGLIPGLPADAQARILAHAEGIPLYAVETVRMLIDRGLLAREGDAYRVQAPIGALDVPETLHSLIAARLDALPPDERALVQDASVLGKSFTREALASVSERPPDGLDGGLRDLVRKELLSVQADPRSPERGQYTFLQELVRRVAYEGLPRRERAARHLAAAAHFERGGAEHEIAAIVASHYLDAYRADPSSADADAIRERARTTLARAGERAASLGAAADAQRFFEQAVELAPSAGERGAMLERAGDMAVGAGALEAAKRRLSEAVDSYREASDDLAAARATSGLGRVEWLLGNTAQAIALTEAAFGGLGDDAPDETVARVAAELARLHFFAGDVERTAEVVDIALARAQAATLTDVTAEALNTASFVALAKGRPEEATAFLKHALDLALANEHWQTALRTMANLSSQRVRDGRLAEASEIGERGIALARKVGARAHEWIFRTNRLDVDYSLGRWDEALARAAEIEPEIGDVNVGLMAGFYRARIGIALARGRPGDATAAIDAIRARQDPGDARVRNLVRAVTALALMLEGRQAEARRSLLDALAEPVRQPTDVMLRFGPSLEFLLDQLIAASDEETITAILARLDAIPVGLRRLPARGHELRARAVLAARSGRQDEAARAFAASAEIFRGLGYAFRLAVTQCDHGEWLVGLGDIGQAAPLLMEARATFERLGARPYLERTDRALSARPLSVGVATPVV